MRLSRKALETPKILPVPAHSNLRFRVLHRSPAEDEATNVLALKILSRLLQPRSVWCRIIRDTKFVNGVTSASRYGNPRDMGATETYPLDSIIERW